MVVLVSKRTLITAVAPWDCSDNRVVSPEPHSVRLWIHTHHGSVLHAMHGLRHGFVHQRRVGRSLSCARGQRPSPLPSVARERYAPPMSPASATYMSLSTDLDRTAAAETRPISSSTSRPMMESPAAPHRSVPRSLWTSHGARTRGDEELLWLGAHTAAWGQRHSPPQSATQEEAHDGIVKASCYDKVEVRKLYGFTWLECGRLATCLHGRTQSAAMTHRA